MGVALGLAYVIFVFGPATIMYWKFISRTAETNLIAISSAFVWLLSIMPPSIIQFINGGVEDNTNFIPLYVLLLVLFQEAGRYWFIKGYIFADKRVMEKGLLSKSLFSDLPSAIAAGFGIGVLNALVWHGGAISGAFAERQNGDFFRNECDGVSVYFLSAFYALFFQPFHIALSILMFSAFRKYSLKLYTLGAFRARILAIVMCHVLGSMFTTFALLKKGCDASIPTVFVTVCATSYWAYRTVRNADYETHGQGPLA